MCFAVVVGVFLNGICASYSGSFWEANIQWKRVELLLNHGGCALVIGFHGVVAMKREGGCNGGCEKGGSEVRDELRGY